MSSARVPRTRALAETRTQRGKKKMAPRLVKQKRIFRLPSGRRPGAPPFFAACGALCPSVKAADPGAARRGGRDGSYLSFGTILATARAAPCCSLVRGSRRTAELRAEEGGKVKVDAGCVFFSLSWAGRNFGVVGCCERVSLFLSDFSYRYVACKWNGITLHGIIGENGPGNRLGVACFVRDHCFERGFERLFGIGEIVFESLWVWWM